MKRMTYEQWHAEGVRRFGPDEMLWRFICPECKHVASPQDWRAAGAPQEAVAFSCVGRWLTARRSAFVERGRGPCDYAGGGLIAINPVVVVRDGKENAAFDFAPEAARA